ncbi:hypothetical protein OM2255_00167 [alpha proteobacterium HTCC2255]|jgi:hypothetical protein|nr:hypothetical protein OM2255_00167 [alpha proteobacterium HTCC2255] [Rhodobacterales bacterium HTCC2255]
MQAPEPLLRAQNIANILDMAVKIPFIGIRVGLDFLIGLIPVVGDATMLLASLRIVHLGRKLGVPKDIQLKMLTNSFLDFGLGFIPLVGDIFDLFFKANVRNVRLMERWWIENNKGRVDEHAQQALAQWTEEFESSINDKAG